MESTSGRDLDAATEQLLQDLKEVVEDGEELLRAGANELSERGKAARARLSDALASARETGRKLQQRTIAGAKATDRVIRENPYQTLAIAFGVGLLTALLVNRK
ncbi:MAG TPA: DUF883 family protein [Verrucomicrobiae bacterium]|nr:DUF883 family protein [Verrucomicrobiae bacterium]